ncbi:DUF4352 domain-containing protein [Clostridium sp. AWRP]|nr:DUF4352 domain-containing protein [Clostridium sp. AWRP]
MQHKILSIIGILIIIGIIGVATGGNKNQGTKVGESTSANSQAQKEESKKNETKTFKVGDVVQLKDYKITVNKVYNVSETDMDKPKDGNEFIAVDCTVENISKEQKTVSSIAMFKVVDKDGRQCEYSLTGQSAANAGQLDGDVGAGRKITGVYVVEVPKGTTGLELEFDASLISSGQVIVKLN